ncbi:hypothetical protein Gotur_027738 [Gossypium turneri]
MLYPKYACSSITVGRELPAGSGFLARGDGRPRMQVGPETYQCVDREGAVCYELLGAIPEKMDGGRIEMGWLRDTFPDPDDDSTEVERIRYARAYILQIIRGYLMPTCHGAAYI